MSFRTKQAVMVALTCISLSGCSGEPSQSDMQKAVEKSISAQVAATKQQMSALFGTQAVQNAESAYGAGDFAGFSSFEKQACVAAQNAPGYVCDFTFTMKGGLPQSAKGRFVSGNEGWIFQQG